MKTILLLAAIHLCAVTLVAQQPDSLGEDEYKLGQFASREYIEILKHHRLDGRTMLLARERSENLRRAKSGARPQSASQWEFLGPKNQSGRIMGIAIGRSNTDVWYCGADGGGVWKSVNSGESWVPLTDTLPSLRISNLVMSPFDDNLVLAGAHEGYIYRTTDAGKTWTMSGLPGGGYVYDMQFHPTDPQRVLVAAEGGLFGSTDAGKTWSPVRAGGRVVSVCYNPTAPSTITYIQNNLSGQLNIYQTKSSGSEWTTVMSASAQYWSGGMIRVCTQHPDVVYAMLNGIDTVYKSRDSGATWVPTASQPVRSGYHRGYAQLAVSPTDPNIVITGGTSLFRTLDGGNTWVAGDTINTNVHVDQHFFMFPPQIPGSFVCGNDGGIFWTSDYQVAKPEWIDRNNDLATLQIYNCAIHPDKPDTVIVGCQDNGYDKFEGKENNWRIVGGDGFCTLWDYDDPGYFYHEYTNHNLHRADNGFTWWSAKKMSGLPTDSSSNGFYSGLSERSDWFGQAITMSPVDPKVLYIGGTHLYRTRDRADNWQLVIDSTFTANEYDFMTKIAVSPSDPSSIYLGTTYGNVYRVTDNMVQPATSQNITPSFGLSSARIRGIVVSPTNPDVAYIAGDAGWQGKDSSGVWSGYGVMKTVDGGATWTVKSNGLPRGAVETLTYYRDTKTMLAGTSSGLYYSLDAGESWHQLMDFPNVEVWDIFVHPVTSHVLVGTYGRGAIRAKALQLPVITGVENHPVVIPNTSTIEAFPSPTNSGITLRFTLRSASQVRIIVRDVLGNPVLRELHTEGVPGENLISLSPAMLGGLADGRYFVELRNETEMIRTTFVLAR